MQGMLTGLGAPAGAMVIVDRGLVSAENLSWLKDHGYRYLVMTRERLPITTATRLIRRKVRPCSGNACSTRTAMYA